MSYSQMQSGSIALWILMITFFIMALIQFFVLKIHQAWKIVVGTDFSIRGKKNAKDKTASMRLASKRLEIQDVIQSNKLEVNEKTDSAKKDTTDQNKKTETEDITIPLDKMTEECGKPAVFGEETLVLSSEESRDFVDEDKTTVLIREEIEIVMDLEFIHTEEKI